MRYILALLLFTVFTTSFAQYPGRSKLTKTTAKGSMYLYWGYNRTAYTKSDLRIVSDHYDLTFKGAKASDNPYPFSARNYLRLDNITVPQFNLRVGYYFKNNWALSVGYDHLKYVFNNGNHVQLYGYVEEGYDTVSNLSGNYSGETYVTDRRTFHYENSNGLNYLRLQVMRSAELFSFGANKQFSLVWNIGAATGAMLTFNDLRFAGEEDVATVSISGFGLSAHTSFRFEFFRHFFMQTSFSGGYINLTHVRTRPNDPFAYAKQDFGYVEFNTVGGWLWYIKPKKDCDCPKW